MGYFIIVLVLIVLGEVFLFKFYNSGYEQLQKYDKTHSDVQATSPEEFSSRIKSIPDYGISEVNYSILDNKVTFVCKKNKFNIIIENGIAVVEYDTLGFGIRISKIGKILKVFKFSKAVKKAVIINSIMDNVTGKDVAENTKEYIDSGIYFIPHSFLRLYLH